MISAQKITTLFLNYFKEKGHVNIPSSSLIPREDDKSLLFVNAGMVPFKAKFCGYEPISHVNVTSVQRCLRAGGKHNDLENVGYTTRHHTFFEMLGNFSFGGYFKREAIQYAWDFLTQVLKLPAEKLWITVHQDDKESADIWLKELKVDATRFSYCGDSDNFWSMGEVGPCGPCSEIFYDHGPKVQGGPPGSFDAEGDRYVEIWNLVFMQYDRKADGTLLLLPKPCVDTGMGLERLTAVMQGVVSNYDTDTFQVLMKATAEKASEGHSLSSHTLKVIADHIRAIAFLITDGITPNNEGRGYVLRRIIRRALRHGYQSGIKEPFLYRLVPTLVDQMKTVYPELSLAQSHIIQSLLDEEKQFLHTLHHGLQYFEKSLAHLNGKTLSGRLVFKLYDTYGFPADLTAEIARERGLLWDEAAFKVEMDRQKKRSQLAGISSNHSEVRIDLPSVFKGYEDLQHVSHIIGLLNKDHQPVQQLLKGEKGSVILDETPFYAESGGQVGDQGKLWIDTDPSVVSHFMVLDTQKINTTYLHKGYIIEGSLKVGDRIHSQVDSKRRQAIKRHHSVTHLLHAALREQLGANVTQKGSLVAPDYLRFDFHYRPALTSQEVQSIEYRVNQAIWDNLPVKTQLMSLEEAKKNNVVSLFEQKYGEEVRVLSMGDFSHELCGGTHVDNTGEIGYFTITLVTSIASGIKRIEAVAGEAAFEWIQQLKERQNTLTTLFKTSPEHLYTRVEKQMALVKKQASDISELQQCLCRSLARSLSKRAIQIGDMTLVLAIIPTSFADHVREVVDQVKSYLSQSAVIVLGCQRSEGIQISIGVPRQYTHRISAKDIIAWLMPLIEGKGGGRPDFSQMQAKGNKQTLRFALKEIRNWLIQAHERTDI